MSGKRSYDDPCGVARALDLIGERWALLVVRELVFGPKRFTDLHHGLPTASQNVLSHRLRELLTAGIVRRTSPGSFEYELTERGRGLEPVLIHLARWGSGLPMPAKLVELSIDALMFALKTTFDPAADPELRVRVDLRFGSDRFHAEVADGCLYLARGDGLRPAAVITTEPPTLRSVIFGSRDPADARASGELVVEGDVVAADRFVGVFRPGHWIGKPAAAMPK
ncbi:DNA-binding HxlR family transcriptional regulator [Allocatelliglobosispora scoriae]|uniref:DNA-binding HxlR family transcriptional regulator n=1 Tax=Allocatelliglobosispora scoriae TaxID=643052 RepID=A0A841BS49_9ACTN|nr:winged helix-turn-helix transcriptional regulator [Allocatelliglobosispora scoriae]MBB5870019.1 DNA-binding HxlR family transcriptional regulator [Allocatelliglobosispora scoriae]